jgi:hypothetical protein
MIHNQLWIRSGNANNAVLAAASRNFRRLIRLLKIWRTKSSALSSRTQQSTQLKIKVLHGQPFSI